MNHVEASLQIYFTTDYARFKMMNGNRQLNETKIKRIISEIHNGNDMLRYYPIQVKEKNSRLDILDGQHRFFICKQLKRPVFYILVTEEKSMPDIAKINSNVEKWNAEDFINCYVQFDNNNYKLLQSFIDTYGFSLGVSLKLLHDGDPGTAAGNVKLNDIFRSGNFIVNTQKEAIQFAENAKLFQGFKSYKSRPFLIALYKIQVAGLYSISDLAKDFNKRPDYLTEQANYKAYINILEQMVNAGKHKRIIIA